ncbi:MAG: hypothetical protein GXO71_01965 [Caldiserica bacterium]|nr:hypothetical protein [Caldisericota bacterium]
MGRYKYSAVVFLLLVLFSVSFAEDIELSPLIIKGKDISTFPSSPLSLSPGLLRKEKEGQEIPREKFFPLRIKGKIWKGREGYAEVEGGIGSYGSYRGKFLGIVKGKSNTLVFQHLKEGTQGYREEGQEESSKSTLTFLFPGGKISGYQEEHKLNLLGPLGRGKIGKRDMYTTWMGMQFGREETGWDIQGRNFLIREEEDKFSGGESSIKIYQNGADKSFLFAVREEFLRDYYDQGEGEFSYSSLSSPWGIKILGREKGAALFPQYSYTRPLSRKNSLNISLGGGWNTPDLLSLYKLSGTSIRKRFLGSEKYWEVQASIEGNSSFPYSTSLFYQRMESILSWKKENVLWKPTLVSSASFIGWKGKFQHKIRENFIWEGKAMYRQELRKRELPYFIYSGVETSLLRESSRIKEEISLQYNGPRYFERGSKRQLKGFTRINLNLAWKISPRLTVSSSLSYIPDGETEIFKGYPVAPWEYFVSIKLNW